MDKNMQIEDVFDTEVEWDGESITIFQWDENEGSRDMILMLDRDHAQKIIVAIKHAANENGWDI
jgi:hypothetical protein